MILIGQGLFSKVYKKDKKTVFIKSKDYAKECLALFPVGSNFLPKIKSVGEDYEMKYYPKVTSLKNSLKPSHYAIYKELRNLSVGYVKNDYDLYFEWVKQFKTISNKSVKNALLSYMDNLGNYGTKIQFEISPRNVAVNNGNLVLLDCFFFVDQLRQARNKTL